MEADLKYKIENNIDDGPAESILPGYRDSDKGPETRRYKREMNKHAKWISKVEQATGANFEETVDQDLTPKEMDQALVQIQSEIRPQKPAKNNSKYTVDSEGTKQRVIDSKKA